MNPFVLQASLGHASLDMTRRYCAGLSFEDAFREHEKASHMLHGEVITKREE